MPEPPITEADVERMLRGFELFNAGDFDGLREFMAEDVVMERVGGLPPLKGWEAVRGLFEPDAFESQQVEPLRWEIRDNRALIEARIRSVGAGSGAVLELDGWFVWTVAGHLVVRLATFTDEAEARAAFELGQNDSS